jgi:hypothetical protein
MNDWGEDEESETRPIHTEPPPLHRYQSTAIAINNNNNNDDDNDGIVEKHKTNNFNGTSQEILKLDNVETEEEVEESVPISLQVSTPRLKRKTNTVKTGYLKMRKTTLGFIHSWKTYYFLLKRSVLVYKNSKEDKRIAGIINLSKVSIWNAKEETGKPTSFMVYHPLREPTFFLATSIDSMKSWMTAMQSVKDYLASYDEDEDYTSSDDEVTCCGRHISLPFNRKKNRLPPQIFDDMINQNLSMNSPKYMHSKKVDSIEEGDKEIKTVAKVICTLESNNVSITDREAEVLLDLTEEEKIQTAKTQLTQLTQKLSKELNMDIQVQFIVEERTESKSNAYIA